MSEPPEGWECRAEIGLSFDRRRGREVQDEGSTSISIRFAAGVLRGQETGQRGVPTNAMAPTPHVPLAFSDDLNPGPPKCQRCSLWHSTDGACRQGTACAMKACNMRVLILRPSLFPSSKYCAGPAAPRRSHIRRAAAAAELVSSPQQLQEAQPFYQGSFYSPETEQAASPAPPSQPLCPPVTCPKPPQEAEPCPLLDRVSD